MKKVMFVATVVQMHINVFHLPYLKMFKNKSWNTVVCAKNDFQNKSDCIIPYCDKYHDIEFARNPFNIKNYRAYKKLKNIMREEKPDIIHCHTPVAGVLSRLAALKLRKQGTKVIYTAHGFHFYKGAPLLNWLLFCPTEWLCSFFTDTLITINKEDYEFAKKHMHAKTIQYVPGVGVDVDTFSADKTDKEPIKSELGISDEDIMLLSVGELSTRKNHEVVIKALSEIRDSRIHYFIAGKGDKEDYLKNMASSLGIEDRIHFLGFRNDISQILSASDIFCFPSLQEGLPLALMEAMAKGVPCIASNIRGNNDLLTNGEGGYLVSPFEPGEFKEKIEELCNNCDLRVKMGVYNSEHIKTFSLNSVQKEMERIYQKEAKDE